MSTLFGILGCGGEGASMVEVGIREDQNGVKFSLRIDSSWHCMWVHNSAVADFETVEDLVVDKSRVVIESQRIGRVEGHECT